ncbi:MAG: hypothetical protein C4581_09185 [Nitrospiraceae bacterium]|nr:MAG: hypothetical protein C4581_09185 [Nitrospiraceae bacterium]
MKSIRKFIMALITASFIIFSSSESSALHELFKSLDLNKDGKVDRNEFSEDMKKEAFSALDSDKSGEISYEEWKRLYGIEEPDRYGEMFRRIDKDENKGITFFEFSDYADRHSNIDEAFMGLDKNGNNSIEPDEMNMRPLFKWITIRF